MAPPLIDPALFDQLKSKIEEDSAIKKELEDIIDELNQHVSYLQGLLSRIHSTPRSKCTFARVPSAGRAWLTIGPDPPLLGQVEDGIKKEIVTVAKLDAAASKYPYYK
jgi:hypothetical protein